MYKQVRIRVKHRHILHADRMSGLRYPVALAIKEVCKPGVLVFHQVGDGIGSIIIHVPWRDESWPVGIPDFAALATIRWIDRVDVEPFFFYANLPHQVLPEEYDV
jgi:hypothetical protein